MINHLRALGFSAVAFLVGASSAKAQDLGIEVGKSAPAVVVQSLD